MKRKKDGRGRYGARHKAKLPRNATVQQERNLSLVLKKNAETLRKYGTGYRTMWAIPKCQKLMRKHGFKKPGGYSKRNALEGKIFATKEEAEFLVGQVCADIFFLAYKAKASQSQLESISKTFSWGYQLKNGKEGNFEEVRDQWHTYFEPDRFGKPSKTLKAEVCHQRWSKLRSQLSGHRNVDCHTPCGACSNR